MQEVILLCSRVLPCHKEDKLGTVLGKCVQGAALQDICDTRAMRVLLQVAQADGERMRDSQGCSRGFRLPRAETSHFFLRALGFNLCHSGKFTCLIYLYLIFLSHLAQKSMSRLFTS